MKQKSHGTMTKTASQSDKDKIFWEKYEEKLIPVSGKLQAISRVSYKLGATISTGNYEFLRCDVEVELPCIVKEVPKTIEYLRKYVESELQKDVKHYREVGGIQNDT